MSKWGAARDLIATGVGLVTAKEVMNQFIENGLKAKSTDKTEDGMYTVPIKDAIGTYVAGWSIGMGAFVGSTIVTEISLESVKIVGTKLISH